MAVRREKKAAPKGGLRNYRDRLFATAEEPEAESTHTCQSHRSGLRYSQRDAVESNVIIAGDISRIQLQVHAVDCGAAFNVVQICSLQIIGFTVGAWCVYDVSSRIIINATRTIIKRKYNVYPAGKYCAA